MKTDAAQRVLGFMDFEGSYGGLDARSLLGYAVRHFFDNGGSEGSIAANNAALVAAATQMVVTIMKQ